MLDWDLFLDASAEGGAVGTVAGAAWIFVAFDNRDAIGVTFIFAVELTAARAAIKGDGFKVGVDFVFDDGEDVAVFGDEVAFKGVAVVTSTVDAAIDFDVAGGAGAAGVVGAVIFFATNFHIIVIDK